MVAYRGPTATASTEGDSDDHAGGPAPVREMIVAAGTAFDLDLAQFVKSDGDVVTESHAISDIALQAQQIGLA